MALVDQLQTPDGAFAIVADADGAVLASGWTDCVPALLERIHPSLRPEGLREEPLAASDAVRAFYEGDLAAAMRVPVRQRGTDLQVRGWRALREIPPGEPLAYAQFAVVLGAPRAVRAAAGICARNAPALFVPCHRVLRGDDSMGGFAWGVDVKRALLARESGA